MNQRTPIRVSLDSFEGPLDLLLFLIQSHELDISKISIKKITDQYLTYVHLMQELNFEIASEFLVMAATLLHWKSRALLPQIETQSQEEEETILSEDALVLQLIEHQRFGEAGLKLGRFPLLGHEIFIRANSKPPIERVWRKMNLTELAVTYQLMQERLRKRTQILKKETVSLSDKIIEFSEKLLLNQRYEFRTLLPEYVMRPDIVVTFLAALELSRLKKMRLYQQEAYSQLYLELLEMVRENDLQFAIGFNTPTSSHPSLEQTGLGVQI